MAKPGVSTMTTQRIDRLLRSLVGVADVRMLWSARGLKSVHILREAGIQPHQLIRNIVSGLQAGFSIELSPAHVHIHDDAAVFDAIEVAADVLAMPEEDGTGPIGNAAEDPVAAKDNGRRGDANVAGSARGSSGRDASTGNGPAANGGSRNARGANGATSNGSASSLPAPNGSGKIAHHGGSVAPTHGAANGGGNGSANRSGTGSAKGGANGSADADGVRARRAPQRSAGRDAPDEAPLTARPSAASAEAIAAAAELLKKCHTPDDTEGLILERIDVERRGGTLRCRTVLALGDRRYSAIAEVPDSPSAEAELAARVAVDALRAGGLTEAMLEGVGFITIAKTNYCVATVRESGRATPRASAAPLIDSMAASATAAVLNAIGTFTDARAQGRARAGH